MTKKKCKHKHISREITGYQDGYIDKKGIHFGEVYDIMLKDQSDTAVFCNDCGKYLNQEEINELI